MRTIVACPDDYFTDDFEVYYQNFIQNEVLRECEEEKLKHPVEYWTDERKKLFIHEALKRAYEVRELARVGYSLLDVPNNETVIFRLNYPLGNFIEYKITKFNEYDFDFDIEYFHKAMEKYDNDPYFQLLEKEI